MTEPSEVERLAALALRAIRPRFEVWAVDHNFDIEPFDADKPESKYKSFMTQAAFEGWCGALFDNANDEKGGRASTRNGATLKSLLDVPTIPASQWFSQTSK